MAPRVCPVWMGYLIASPIRRWFQDPEKLMASYVQPGMRVLEIGPGIGFFTIPMARMVGPQGRVIAVDVQAGMLDGLRKRAAKADVANVVEARLCLPASLGVADLAESIDFILLFAVVHEVPDQKALFSELSAAARAGCKLLFAEPSGHVREDAFSKSLDLAADSGFRAIATPAVRGSHAALLQK